MSSLRINARSIGAPTALGAVLLLMGVLDARAGSDDTGTFAAIGTAIGVISNDDSQKIDYRERPKLVVPPDRKALPEPRAEGDSRPPSFPVDQTSASRRQSARVVSGQPTSADEPSRDNLTQPPYGFRQPNKPFSRLKTKEEAKSWWNPMGYFGSSSKENSPQPSSVASAQTASGASATAGRSAPEKQETTSWWNPASYLPTFGSR
ncbi:hypothetical protein [Methylocystis bryophila]|uniref:Uncharacterized protein n=1 Tax=Methylocystis bryophila TaxID=655015 RepID=A0A1W6MYJ0_9HYPH|nr:hypothetical protein [Methylocystis bryophila]ARN82652.1 hypothetical protein B1812_17865 [Methylocystis bryophila]BDV38865.1 hypothetical protein DSM21852_21180 [Methylocystis bryophila]